MRAIQNWLDRFCYRHPRFAIPGLMRYVAIINIAAYLLDLFSNSALSGLLYFSVPAILHGEVWRILTFVFVPQTSSMLAFALTTYFYYFIGTALERQWGSVKFTVFYGFGILLNILVGFFIGYATMYYVNMSMFFAFATLFPEMQVLLFFIIPIKVKWLAWADAAFFAVGIFKYITSGIPLLALIPVVAILNYLLFFAGDILDTFSQTRERVRYRTSRQTVNFKSAQQHAKEKKGYLHKCAVCGRTDVSNPELEFRYCSKCNGYYCYCSDHINNHVHVQ